jgi:hypothetical protein
MQPGKPVEQMRDRAEFAQQGSSGKIAAALKIRVYQSFM